MNQTPDYANNVDKSTHDAEEQIDGGDKQSSPDLIQTKTETGSEGTSASTAANQSEVVEDGDLLYGIFVSLALLIVIELPLLLAKIFVRRYNNGILGYIFPAIPMIGGAVACSIHRTLNDHNRRLLVFALGTKLVSLYIAR